MKLEQDKQYGADDSAVQSIVELYGLEFVDYTAATSGIENTTLIVTTKSNKIVVRIYRLGKKTTQEIDLEVNYVRYLHEGGVKVPQILQNNTGEFVTEIEHSGSHWQVISMEHIEGVHADVYTPELLCDIAQTHAKMHLLSGAYDVPFDSTDEYKVLKENYFLPLIDLDQIKDSTVQQFLQRVNKFTVELDSTLPKGLCHLDYDKDNIIAHNNTVAAVLDFDDMALAPFVVCLGYTLWHVWRYAGIDMVGMYLEEYEKLKPLNELEKDYLNKIILFRHYMISDLKIMNGHTSPQDIKAYIQLESDISKHSI